MAGESPRITSIIILRVPALLSDICGDGATLMKGGFRPGLSSNDRAEFICLFVFDTFCSLYQLIFIVYISDVPRRSAGPCPHESTEPGSALPGIHRNSSRIQHRHEYGIEQQAQEPYTWPPTPALWAQGSWDRRPHIARSARNLSHPPCGPRHG